MLHDRQSRHSVGRQVCIAISNFLEQSSETLQSAYKKALYLPGNSIFSTHGAGNEVFQWWNKGALNFNQFFINIFLSFVKNKQ